jgi:hypothetical protein
MTTVTFDTLAFTEELTAAGMPEQQAKAQARAMTKILESQELATKADLAIIQREMATQGDIKELELKIAETKTDLIKWVIGLMLAQTGLIIAAIKLIP